MRRVSLLLLLALLAGCRVVTAPTLAPQSMRYGIPGAPTWAWHVYDANDRFPELADLTYHRAGDKLVLEARFMEPPAAIGDQWFGAIDLFVPGERVWIEEGSLSIRFGDGAVQAWRIDSNANLLSLTPATARIVGPILLLTCDANVLDFTPQSIMFLGTAHPECAPHGPCGQEAVYIRNIDQHGPVAAVER